MAKQVQGGPPPPTTDQDDTVLPAGISMRDLGVVDGIGSPDVPRLESRAAALFLFHPERWGVLEGQVVPLLGRMPIIAGVGNVKLVDAKRGLLSTSVAEHEKSKRGWTKIRLDVDGPGTSYLHSPLTGVYLTRWETAHAGSSVISHDTAGYVRWLRGLVATGKIPRAKPYVLEKIRAKTQRQILELQDKVRTVPSAQVDLDRKLADLAAIQRELGTMPLTPIAPKPTGLDGLVTE